MLLRPFAIAEHFDVPEQLLFGLRSPTTGIAHFYKLVHLVVTQEPYRSARRVFWTTGNGSSHRGVASVQRLKEWYPNAVQIHTPVHASWLNQYGNILLDCPTQGPWNGDSPNTICIVCSQNFRIWASYGPLDPLDIAA